MKERNLNSDDVTLSCIFLFNKENGVRIFYYSVTQETPFVLPPAYSVLWGHFYFEMQQYKKNMFFSGNALNMPVSHLMLFISAVVLPPKYARNGSDITVTSTPNWSMASCDRRRKFHNLAIMGIAFKVWHFSWGLGHLSTV